MTNFVGTSGADTLTGGGVGDTLAGLAGDDTLIGNDGDDVLDGGPGNDSLDGGLGSDTAQYSDLGAAVTVDLTKQGVAQNTGGGGSDTLNSIEQVLVLNSPFADTLIGDGNDNRLLSYGGGDDRLEGGDGSDVVYADVNPDGHIPPLSNSAPAPASTITLIGGAGDDQLIFQGTTTNGRTPYIDTVLLDGGDGNDTIMATGGGTTTISGGAGNDTVYLYTLGGNSTITLGAGSDRLTFSQFANDLQASHSITVTDFATGVGGDVFDISDWLNGTTLSGHFPGTDPIAGGWVRLLQSGADTLFQVDRDGGGDAFTTLVTFQNVAASSIISNNIAGFSLPPINGTPGNDVNLHGTEGDDTINGLAGNDIIFGGGGFDVIDGGDGDDILTGGLGRDSLTGGAGNDVFRDTLNGFDQDSIVDFSVGDRLQITDVDSVTFAPFRVNLGILVDGVLLLPTPQPGYHLAETAMAGGGVEITLVPDAPSIHTVNLSGDFNGDGRDDILWRNDAGSLSNWLGQGNGGFTTNDANALAAVPTSWKIAGAGDFNGDGKDDLLWRNDNGAVSDWLAKANGGFSANDANALTSVPTSWHVASTGDFNGDGRDDIVWRNDNGQVSDWLGQANGGFTSNDANALVQVPTDWKIVATGDFNNDGRDDILWRNSVTGQVSNWLAQANGGFTPNDANALASVPANWHIVGTGDFNGDGRDDILWRSDSGQVSNWLGQANGGFVANDANALTTVTTDWQVMGTGDYNGDGRSDILWRNDNGTLSDWLGQTNGGFVPNDANALTVGIPTTWHVQIADTSFA